MTGAKPALASGVLAWVIVLLGCERPPPELRNVVLVSLFFNDTATTEIYTTLYTLSLHDALPI
jgi:hypothetical protein